MLYVILYASGDEQVERTAYDMSAIDVKITYKRAYNICTKITK